MIHWTKPSQRGPDARHKRWTRSRCGAAAVEFAVVAPLLFSVVLAILEFGRGMMVAETLAAAARAGCRAASLSGATTASATNIVTNNLTGITGTSVTMTVNGASKNVSQSVSGDTVAVTVSVPYSSVSWLPTASSPYLKSINLSGSASMCRE